MRAIVTATLATLTLATISAMAVPALASDVVSITWRKAEIMSFGGGVSSIIIGDPKVIDVTLEGSGQVVVFGKVPGETNMMVLGSDNTVLYDAVIIVMPEDDRQVSIISPGSNVITERSWTCLTRCVQVLGPAGTTYASVRAQGGGSSAAGVGGGAVPGDPSAELGAAAGQTAQGVADSNRGTGQAGSAVGGAVSGQPGTIIAPY
ncbi:MAG: pilus assembly protein N-terminal domain-containing protein [Rhodospirillaceae bacterium]|nr:pilus assembly protein N-terminal domain-containing protein [Rhodospirillaceae bacterium]